MSSDPHVPDDPDLTLSSPCSRRWRAEAARCWLGGPDPADWLRGCTALAEGPGSRAVEQPCERDGWWNRTATDGRVARAGRAR